MNSELNKLLDEMEALRKHLKRMLWEDPSLNGIIPDGSRLEETSCRTLDALWNLRKETLIKLSESDKD